MINSYLKGLSQVEGIFLNTMQLNLVAILFVLSNSNIFQAVLFTKYKDFINKKAGILKTLFNIILLNVKTLILLIQECTEKHI